VLLSSLVSRYPPRFHRGPRDRQGSLSVPDPHRHHLASSPLGLSFPPPKFHPRNRRLFFYEFGLRPHSRLSILPVERPCQLLSSYHHELGSAHALCCTSTSWFSTHAEQSVLQVLFGLFA